MKRTAEMLIKRWLWTPRKLTSEFDLQDHHCAIRDEQERHDYEGEAKMLQDA